MPKISIVLPAYNAAAFIRQTIESILAQTYDDFEIVVVNDGSRDATAEIVTGMDPRVRVLNQHNQGIALARNAGIAAAAGEWIAFMDHDDLWHPQKLAVEAAVLERDAECGIVFGEFLRWDPNTPPAFPDPTLDADRIVENLSGRILHRLAQTNWVLLSTAVIRKEVFEQCGLFDPSMPPADDWDFVLRVAEKFSFTKLAQPLALYRVHTGQTSLKLTPVNFEYMLRQRTLDRLQEIGGPMPDPADIRRRQFRALFNYGLAQYRGGLYKAAAQTFAHALRYRRISPKATGHLVASLVRAWIPKV